MKFREYEFDGTPEELLMVYDVVSRKHKETLESKSEDKPESRISDSPIVRESLGSDDPRDARGRRFVTVEQAKRILTRRPLSPKMKSVLIELYGASDQETPSERLMVVTDFTDEKGGDRFRGLLGAFGRRTTHDVGIDVEFLNKRWDTDRAEMVYRLPQTVRKAMEDLGWV